VRFGVVKHSGRPQATSVQLYTGSSPNGWIDTKYGLYKLLSPEGSRLVNSWVGTNVSEEGNLRNTLYQTQNFFLHYCLLVIRTKLYTIRIKFTVL